MASYKPSRAALVLVVEDEPLLRLHAVDFIEDAGFEVVEARNADEAFVILSTRNDIRIVFTDIDMPGSMDGLKLALAIRDRWPPIEVIVTSGKIDPPSASLPDRSVFFGKPYNEGVVLHAIRTFAETLRPAG